MEWQFIRYLRGTAVALPSPWEKEWGAFAPAQDFDMPTYDVARAPAGTPIPEGDHIAPYDAPVPAALLEAAKLAWDRYDCGNDPCRRAVQDFYRSPQELAEGAWGAYNYLAPYAPRGLSKDKAIDEIYAHTQTTSRQSCAVIRVAPKGYDVFIGIGSLIERRGKADTYKEAEALAIKAVLRARRAFDEHYIQVLRDAGWSPDTPMWSTTIQEWVTKMPIQISRGPLFMDTAGCSWDLPVYAKWVDGQIEYQKSQLGWDDEEERRKWWARNRAGQDRVQTAVEMLRKDPRFEGLVRAHDLVREEVTIRGVTGTLCGPVKWDADRQAPAVLLEYSHPRRTIRTWITVDSPSPAA